MTEYRPEPTDAEIVGGEYQPYQTHMPQQDAELVPQGGAAPIPAGTEDDADSDDNGSSHQFILSIVSLGTGIPITAIAAESVDPGLLGLAVAWAGIIGVNLTHYLARKRRR